jgi:2-octaprenyl-6-methoxyphenol hydroxylase
MAGQNDRVDVIIGGAGLVGLALAIALKRGLGSSFAVTVADPALGRTSAQDVRASAITAAPRRMLESLGVWSAVADQAQPILDMAITDSRLNDTIRPVFLTFGEEVEPGEPFAHMVENTLLNDALLATAREQDVDLRAVAVAGFSPPNGGGMNIAVGLGDGATLAAPLLVAADGARSAIRERAGITTYGWSYGQSAIVTNVAHERDHHGRAEEHFLPAGPFAILPLTGKRSSIVWTEEGEAAERIVGLPDALFHDELERRFGLHLGEIKVLGPRRAYPVGLAIARSFIGERIALAGDAAHTIHPIAGQGLNLGLRDVAALAEAVVDAARLGLDIGGGPVLERYQRWRRFDTIGMGLATDGLNRLFSNRSDALRLMRDVGLGLVERLPRLKRAFVREAAGFTGDVPKLLRGEAL